MAFLMAASASLEGVSKMSSDKDSTEYLAMANKMLPKYQAAAQALTARQQSLGEPPGIAEDKCQQYMLIMVSKNPQHQLLNGMLYHLAMVLLFAALLRHVIRMLARTWDCLSILSKLCGEALLCMYTAHAGIHTRFHPCQSCWSL